MIKPNWVGMIYREGYVDPQTYTFLGRPDYMNTAPQMILALLGQLIGIGVAPSDITVCDTLAYLVNEYHGLLHRVFPNVRYEDYGGQFGRVKVSSSTVPLYWSCRPQAAAQDFLPTCFAEADYLVNFANFKAHSGSGVTLCQEPLWLADPLAGRGRVLQHAPRLLCPAGAHLPTAGGSDGTRTPRQKDGAEFN